MLPASRRGCEGWWEWWAGVVGRRAAVRGWCSSEETAPGPGSILLLRRPQHGAHAGADGAAAIEGRGGARIWRLQTGRRFTEQLECAPADHGDAGGADGVSLGDQPAGCIDGALAIGRRLALDPVLGALAGLGFADHFRAQRAHHGEAI